MRHSQSVFLAAAGTMLLLLAPAAFGTVWYVNASNSPGGDGLDWTTALTTIQGGVNAAAAGGGGEVWVAKGIYYEVDLNGGASLQLKSGVQLYGGFSGTESSRGARNADAASNGTVIHGTAHTGDYIPVAPVVQGADDAVLDGFTVTGGRAADGAGMLNADVSPQVANCIFEDNHALAVTNSQGTGGGMHNTAGAAPTVVKCVFRDNAADLFGGGLASEGSSAGEFTDCTFADNVSNMGGGVSNNSSSPSFINCAFTGNVAFTRTVEGSGSILGFGGGVYNIGRLPDQYPTELGDAPVADPTFVNCLFAANYTDGYGGAVFNTEGLGLFAQCTMALNGATACGGIYNFDGAKPELVNSIVYGNTSPAITDSANFFFDLPLPDGDPAVAVTIASYSDIEGRLGRHGKHGFIAQLSQCERG